MLACQHGVAEQGGCRVVARQLRVETSGKDRALPDDETIREDVAEMLRERRLARRM